MDALHNMLRNIRDETKARRDHITVFREFLNHLDRIGRKPRSPIPKNKAVRPAQRRGK
jgi:hypothetical protein